MRNKEKVSKKKIIQAFRINTSTVTCISLFIMQQLYSVSCHIYC